MVQARSEHFDVVVIGGGPAGLMAAIAAQSHGASTLLIEKGNKLGRKLGISGGGRCNVTNAKPLPELMQNIPGNARFLYSALNQFSNQDIIHFFEDLGIAVKEEDRGRVFPTTDKAATVVQALVNRTFDAGVEVWTDLAVRRLLVQAGDIQGVELQNRTVVQAKTVIVATGGCSVPKTGSTGDAYPWAAAVGHSIVTPYPTEVPLTSSEPFIQARWLQGISLRNVDMTIRSAKGKALTTENGDMIFTHFGLSGPVALRCSHYVSTELRKSPGSSILAEINLLQGQSASALTTQLQTARRTDAKKHIGNLIKQDFDLPERLIDFILQQSQVNGSTQTGNLNNMAISALVQWLTSFSVSLTGTLPLEQATITGGGVSVKEIDPKTMESKKCRGLFFAGEVMDVHAHTGGYNITVAFSTGRLAGTSAALLAQGVSS